ncbi:MAG: hypothetical protein IJT36_00595 [Alphaproteobacteria bacterium]|nr:hypothetical protein [Alphaproteobacteria bacterium]
MKRIALVLCATVSLFSGISAMDSAQQESGTQQQIPVKMFVVQTVPPVEVMQIPSDEKVILDGFIRARSINIECFNYNGIQLNAPIKLSYDMTTEQMVSALMASFGADKQIQFLEGTLTRNH